MRSLNIEHYIQCFENCTLRHLESLAMLGLAVEVYEESCLGRRFKRLVEKLFNGKTVSSACYFDEEIAQSIKVISTYIEIARKNNAIGKLTVVESSKENEL